MKMKHLLGSVAVAALTTMASVANAQIEKPAATVVDPVTAGLASDQGEIVVTANRREEKLQNVPISVAAVGGTALSDLNIKRPEELVRLIPGLGATPNSGSAVTSYSIRGVGQSDFAEHEEQPVAVYQDGVYVPNAAASGFPIFDVARAEVLRGPQGTLFGRNATGGLVQFFSVQPSEGFSGGVSLTGGDRNLRRIEGALNYGSEKFAVRVAGYHSEQDGYVKNLLGENLLSQRVNAVRAQFRYAPDADTVATLRLEGFNFDGTSENKTQPSYFDAAGRPIYLPANVDAYGTGPGKDFYGFRDVADPYVQAVTDPGAIEKRARTAALTISHDFGTVSLFSTSSYTSSKVYYREDTDGIPLRVYDYADGGKSDTFSQELRLQKSIGSFRATGGVYFLNIDGNYFAGNNAPTLCDPTNAVICSYATNKPLDGINGKGAFASTLYRLRTRSVAVFAQGEYDLNDQLTFVLGGRYTWDNQKFQYQFNCAQTIAGACQAIFGVGNNPGAVSGLGQLNLKQSFANWSGKVGLNYKVTPDILAYVSASRGIKSSGYFAPNDGQVLPNQLNFLPEKLNAFEAGLKTTLFDRHVTANLAMFHYDYKNFQTFQFSGVSSSVVNRDAYANGGEFELTVRPGRGFNANVGVAYNDFWVKNIATIPSTLIQRQRAINAPKWQVNFGASKAFNLSDGLTLKFAYNGRYTSERFFNIVNVETVRIDGFTLHDATVSLDTPIGISVSAFVTNFTNKAYANSRFDQTGQGFAIAHYGEPRTFGLSAGYKF